MENKEFVLETLKRITPDTSWHGETDIDEESLKNIDILDEMIDFILDELFKDYIVPSGNKGNRSYEKIAAKKQKIIRALNENIFMEIELPDE